MNNQATMEKMSRMKLHGMCRAFQATMETSLQKKFTADELLAHIIDAEWDDRHNRKINRLIHAAKFRYQASIEEIDFQRKRNLDKNMVLRLSDCGWVTKSQDITVTGPTGAGKSFIASALGYQSCRFGFRTLYFNCAKLFSLLKYAKADGSIIKHINNIQKQDVLILDDFGLHPVDTQVSLLLLEILEDRHGRKSTIIASQFPVGKWHGIVGEPTIADAICDRIIHSSFRIEMKMDGDSLRKDYCRKTEQEKAVSKTKEKRRN